MASKTKCLCALILCCSVSQQGRLLVFEGPGAWGARAARDEFWRELRSEIQAVSPSAGEAMLTSSEPLNSCWSEARMDADASARAFMPPELPPMLFGASRSQHQLRTEQLDALMPAALGRTSMGCAFQGPWRALPALLSATYGAHPQALQAEREARREVGQPLIALAQATALRLALPKNAAKAKEGSKPPRRL